MILVIEIKITLDEVENCLAPLRTDFRICGFVTAAMIELRYNLE